MTDEGTAVLFVTHFEGDKRINSGKRIENGIMRSFDHGLTWTDYEPFDPGYVGYPCAVAVSGNTSYVLFDNGPHVLYVSTDDGQTWAKRSELSLDNDKWYGTMCIMADGRILAGAYFHDNEGDFYYCISGDGGYTWSEQKTAALDKKIRDPELAYLGGQYYLHGRSGHYGFGAHRFVLYQSRDGEHWNKGVVVSSDERGYDGYSHNCIVHKYDTSVPNELMVLYSIVYEGLETDEYVFFIRPDGATKE